MPDLGTYAQPILMAYASGLLILAIIVVSSILRHRRAKARLAATVAQLQSATHLQTVNAGSDQ